ncbi:WD repeat-containing protein on Y chromosome-like isoform X2 [Biomphalaria glabrata]|uniref:WD repeat-containing protein on Y chromosome-like isoform X2 n=1 Tax=Biomphalaria glabrata TaxID=6526 RepID=A0A2C9JDI5_BIOGL|nr:WD repeat-containing protein on Y chromosome-like isoform X2 [Biomphalaria glabrata]
MSHSVKMPSNREISPFSPLPPIKKRIRPTSASANLQTHPSYTTGLYDNVLRTSSLATGNQTIKQRPHTQAGGPREQNSYRPVDTHENVKHPRRLTLGTVEGIAELDSILRVGNIQISAAQQLKDKIEEKINIDTLEELKSAFMSADVNRTGSLDLEEFKKLLKEQLGLGPSKDAQIDSLFMKIDWSSEGAISWDEFCTYMQLEYAEKEDSYLRAKEVSFHLPAKIESIPHRDLVLRITDTSDGTFIACSQEGTVTFWSSNTELKRTRSVVNQDIMSNRTKSKWITDFCLMPHFNKLIVGTGDREIQFFELSSFDPYCQIYGLETVPLKLDYSSTGHDECLILFGDNVGCVNIFVIKSAGECLRTWKKMTVPDGFIATIHLDAVISGFNVNFIRWQVHEDWVGQIKYYHDIGQVISCSNHPSTALVIGSTTGSTHVEQQLREIKDVNYSQEKNKQKAAYNIVKKRLGADETVFKVYKGVKVFDFSKAKNVIVTGGMDRIIRLWNPYVSLKPTAMLRGHAAPIFYLTIAEEDNRIYSISTDRCIRVWDIQDHTCLLTIRPKSHKIRGDLQAVYYSNISRSLAVATDQMAIMNLKHKSSLNADMVVSHKDPVTCCKYNPEFKQIVTCCCGSIVKLWDFETGSLIFEYGEAHGEEAITCMTFDNTKRRLITGGRDGSLKIWNYNNGHCLRVLKKKAKKNNVHTDEICDVTYIEMNKNRYVIAVGWDKRINIYYDTVNDTNIQYVQHPTPYWLDDLKNGHKEDVLSIAHCLPNLLATGSYDGEVIVWNMVSGHIFCHLRPPPPPGYEDQNLDGDMNIAKLIFLQTRASKKDAGALVVSGPRAHIHIWNVSQGGTLMAQFQGSSIKGSMVSQLVSNSANTVLYSSDTSGFIYAWNLTDYCLTRPAHEPPELLYKWRGHVESVASMDLVESNNVLVTSSSDCTVRLWTHQGHYIGTLGQSEQWDLYNPSTFQHPMVPYEVLIDPLSLPSHPVLLEKQSTHDIIHQGDEDKSLRSVSPQVVFNTKQSYVVDDEKIKALLEERPFDKGTGKRLRHEKHKKMRDESSGTSVWQEISCHQLQDPPKRESPVFRKNKDDYYADELPQFEN